MTLGNFFLSWECGQRVVSSEFSGVSELVRVQLSPPWDLGAGSCVTRHRPDQQFPAIDCFYIPVSRGTMQFPPETGMWERWTEVSVSELSEILCV